LKIIHKLKAKKEAFYIILRYIFDLFVLKKIRQETHCVYQSIIFETNIEGRVTGRVESLKIIRKLKKNTKTLLIFTENDFLFKKETLCIILCYIFDLFVPKKINRGTHCVSIDYF